MAGSGREARRRRILEGGQDRLALITGRKPDQSPPFVPHSPDLISHHVPPLFPSASFDEDDNSLPFKSATNDQASKLHQSDVSSSEIKEVRFVRKPDQSPEPSWAPALENRSTKGESSSAVPSVLLTASNAALRLVQQIPIGNITSRQVSAAVTETEQDRMLCAITMAILVVLSYSGFPIVGSRILRWFILFRPLFLVLIANFFLIIRRFRPENRRNLIRGEKEDDTSLLGEGYAWAEEAGRALELGFMLQNMGSAVFIDCSVYATIVVFGLSLFG